MNNSNLNEADNSVLNEFEPIDGWYPLEVQIEITYDCTLRCAMCYNGVRANERKFDDYIKSCNFETMSDSKLKKINNVLNLCLDNGAKFFTITGGEPLLYPDVVIEMIKKIKEKGGYASINSNATLIDEELASRLKDAGLDSALISIHGSDEKTHAKTVCVKEAFDKTKNGIRALLKNDIRVVPNFVASHANVSNLKDTAEMLYKLGIKNQAYSIFIPTPNVLEHESLKMTLDDNISYFKQLNSINSEHPDLKATATLPVPPCLSKGIVSPEVLEKFEFRTCPSGRQFMVVNAEGNASPCIQYAWNETYGDNVIVSGKDVVNKLRHWKELLNLPEKCFNCGCKGFCNPCNMNILRENKDILSQFSIPYPGHDSLTEEEGEIFQRKFEIKISKDCWHKVYKLKDNIIIRKERDGYITLINPNIQGYTVLKDITTDDLNDEFIFSNHKHYQLFKAMNAIEMCENYDINNIKSIDMKLVPKYKILTEFIGWNFDNEEAVYCTRTDTAGRFYCLANTELEQKVYDEARLIYVNELNHIKKIKLAKN